VDYIAGRCYFHFVTDGIQSALDRAKEAAGDRDVKIMGGASTVNQYLAAGLIDELWLHVAPVILGKGIRLFEGVSNIRLEPMDTGGSSKVIHIRYRVLR